MEEPNSNSDIQELAKAFEAFTQTTRSMEEAYRRLEARVHELDRELENKVRELAVTNDYLSNLLESMSEGVIAVDRDGNVTRFNRAAGIILGYTAEEVVGRNFQDTFGRSFTTPRQPAGVSLRAKSGREVPVSERDSPIAGADGARLGIVKTFQDLSELKALREQVRQMDRLAALGEMAATVAHEIRNPLGGIRGFAAFLAQDIPEDDPKRRLVDKILSGTASLDRVVNELLEYTRPVELRLQPAACAEIFQAALRYVPIDPEKVALRNDLPGNLKVLADRDQIRQVFINVLLNAVQSMGDGGELSITAEDEESSQVEVRIQDTGCGIAPDCLEKVFSPFFTTKEKGTGLGLAVCAKIVEGHGGAIRAESTPGNGTLVRISLPRAE